MPQLSSEIGEARQFQLIPKSLQNAHVYELVDTDPNDPSKFLHSKSGKIIQCILGWEVDEGEFAGRKVRYNYLVLKGTYTEKDTNQEKDMPITKLLDFLSFTGVPWECNLCKSGKRGHRFLIGTGDDGLIKGKYYCPDCKADKISINYNTSDFMGARCAISIGSEKRDGQDNEYNVVRGYAPLRTY